MAVIKQACPKCGQRVSGDESFYGTSVDCPICSAKIFFPDPDKKETTESTPAAAESSVHDREPHSEPSEKKGSSKDLRHSAENKSRSTEPEIQGEAPKVKVSRSLPPVNQGYAEPPSPTLSIISMVLGIINAITFCIPSMLLAPAAIICGHIALIKGQFSPIQPAPGRSMAITGLILGYVGMTIMLLTLGLKVTGIFDVFGLFKGHFGNSPAN